MLRTLGSQRIPANEMKPSFTRMGKPSGIRTPSSFSWGHGAHSSLLPSVGCALLPLSPLPVGLHVTQDGRLVALIPAAVNIPFCVSWRERISKEKNLVGILWSSVYLWAHQLKAQETGPWGRSHVVSRRQA